MLVQATEIASDLFNLAKSVLRWVLEIESEKRRLVCVRIIRSDE